MKLRNISEHCNELTFANGNSVLFSYETPVAICFALPFGHYLGIYKTEAKFSRTTSKHINAWTGTTKTLPQIDLENLVNAAAV